jgi:hypothetical protein
VKSKRILAGLGVVMCLVLLVGIVSIITSRDNTAKAYSVPLTGSTLGITQLTMSGSNALNLASGTTTVGSSGIPCSGLQLQVTGGSALIGAGGLTLTGTYATAASVGSTFYGTSTGTAACTYPLYVNGAPSSGTATSAALSYNLPQVTNTNQVWIYSSGAGSATTVNAVYSQ